MYNAPAVFTTKDWRYFEVLTQIAQTVYSPSAMPRNLSENDRETVKRTVPKASNKIIAVAIARLYIAFPNRQLWTYTGLQGAAVLTNDLVGNTFWIKLVDISVCRVTLSSLACC